MEGGKYYDGSRPSCLSSSAIIIWAAQSCVIGTFTWFYKTPIKFCMILENSYKIVQGPNSVCYFDIFLESFMSFVLTGGDFDWPIQIFLEFCLQKLSIFRGC